jgi:hypothetical protein
MHESSYNETKYIFSIGDDWILGKGFNKLDDKAEGENCEDYLYVSGHVR